MSHLEIDHLTSFGGFQAGGSGCNQGSDSAVCEAQERYRRGVEQCEGASVRAGSQRTACSAGRPTGTRLKGGPCSTPTASAPPQGGGECCRAETLIQQRRADRRTVSNPWRRC